MILLIVFENKQINIFYSYIYEEYLELKLWVRYCPLYVALKHKNFALIKVLFNYGAKVSYGQLVSNL